MSDVTVYSQPSCGSCIATKKHLERKGIDFTEVNVREDDDAYQHVVSLGYQQMPVVEAGDIHFSGYKPKELDKLA